MRKLLDRLPNMAALKTICNKIHQSIKINQALPRYLYVRNSFELSFTQHALVSHGLQRGKRKFL